jgi:predicted Zn finger-like uncharacterized protein
VKFLCDQCKAKYQISDDKVAGKTVRMKCRKCGHQIEVRAAVTESSVSTSLPPPADSLPPPGMAAGGNGAAAGGPARPPVPGAPRPPAAPRANAMATSLSAARPAAPKSPQRGPGGGGGEGALAGAFTSQVQKHDEASQALELLELSTADEWYVAINGVPVGPVRMTELRRKAALGAVTDESLVWQEGLEEWRMVRSIPELSAVVREAASSGRVSLVTPEPGQARQSFPPPAPSPSGRPPPRAAVSPSRAPEPPRPAARNNVVPITSRLATAEKLDELPFASDAPHAGERISFTADPFAIPPPAATAVPLSLPPPAPTDRRAGGPPWLVIGMLVLFGAFGITAAIMVFGRAPQVAAPPPAPVVIQMPAAPTSTPVAAAPAETASAAPVASTGKPGAVAKAGTGTASAKPGAGGAALDPSVANLLRGSAAGPAVGGGSAAGGGGGGSLTSDQVEGVVRNHSLAVRRSCWERGGSSATSANITVAITVGGSGAVQNASASGNEPAVAKCIESAVKGWQFPPTGGTTTVNIPFHFVRQ